ncbi:MAG TPA: hypothetical protein VGG74_20905 [Kofleriaceae bacterium]
MTTVYASAAISPPFAWFVIGGSAILFIYGTVIGFLRARQRTRLAEAAEASVGTAPPPLVEGSDVVLTGLVRHAAERDVAVKVSITQHGSESESSGSWSHSWTEIDREIILAPFLLELADKTHVLVEPPRNVDVADALDQKVLIARDRRVLSAELVPGEKIFARGRLERSDQVVATRGYRDVQWGWTLRPSHGQMLLSSEPLGAGLRERAKFHSRYARRSLVFLVATQLTLVLFYGRVAGETRAETVTNAGSYETTDDDGDTHYHFVIEVNHTNIDADNDGIMKGDVVPIRFANDDNWQLGEAATIQWWHALMFAAVSIGSWLVYRARRRSSRPWFRRKVNESGSGRLPDRA